MNGALAEVLGAILLLDALVGSLCLVILIVRRVFCRWPDAKLHLNEGETRIVDGGQSLLAAVRGEGFLLPGSCGGRGTCGICRVKVRRGGGESAPAEVVLVSPSDRRSGVRLACQVRVRGEIEADLPEDALTAKFVRAFVTANEKISDDINRLQVKVEEPIGWKFTAGQYVQIFREKPHPGDEPLTRAYSLASDSATPDSIELHIRRVPGGEMSPWLCDRKTGDPLWFSGPYGTMTLPEIGSDTDIICVAGGVGFAPMKSIVLAIAGRRAPPKTWLFVGAATAEVLYDHDWATGMAGRYPWLVYVPCVQNAPGSVAEEKSGHALRFEPGLVTEALERRFPNGKKAVALLCGPERMVAASRLILAAKGLPPAGILADVF